jgi:hypothetical protein
MGASRSAERTPDPLAKTLQKLVTSPIDRRAYGVMVGDDRRTIGITDMFL